MNFEGRISLLSALAWGLGALLAVKLFKPIIDKLYVKLYFRRWFKVLEWILIIGCVICALSKYWWFSDILAPQQT